MGPKTGHDIPGIASLSLSGINGLLAIVLIMEFNVLVALFVMREHCWILFSCVSTLISTFFLVDFHEALKLSSLQLLWSVPSNSNIAYYCSQRKRSLSLILLTWTCPFRQSLSDSHKLHTFPLQEGVSYPLIIPWNSKEWASVVMMEKVLVPWRPHELSLEHFSLTIKHL